MSIKKKIQISITALALVCLSVIKFAQPTLAFYSATDAKNNRIITKGSSVLLQEVYDPKDTWVAGETKEKIVDFGNAGESDQLIRFKADVVWYDVQTNTVWTYNTTDYPDAVKLNWTTALVGADGNPATLDAGQQWVYIDGYYYYNKVLPAASGSTPAMTDAVLNSVTFSDKLSNDAGHSTDFSNKRVEITVTMEAVYVNNQVVGVMWPGRSFTQSGTAITWS